MVDRNVDDVDAIKTAAGEQGRSVVDIGHEVASKYGAPRGTLLHFALCEAALEGYALGSRRTLLSLSHLLERGKP